MKDKIKKWAEALESGKYKQCTGRLKDGDSYCCLGVLCEINGVDMDKSPVVSIYSNFIGNILPPERYKKYYNLNDAKGLNFKEIAKVIREDYGL